MAMTEYYCDFATGTDDLAAGRGDSSGDPWKTFKYAVDTGIPNTGRNAVDGDKLWVGDAADNPETARTSWFNYGTSLTAAAPFVIEGYDSGGGTGIGVIAKTGNSDLIDELAADYLYIKNMKFTHAATGTTYYTIRWDNFLFCLNVEFVTAGLLCVEADSECFFVNCKFTSTSTNANSECLSFLQGGVYGCFFDGPPGATSRIVTIEGNDMNVSHSILVVNHVSGIGININAGSQYGKIFNNTVYNSTAGTAAGIDVSAGNDQGIMINNHVEGFSGVGGIGIKTGGNDVMLGNNSFYNNTANYDSSRDLFGIESLDQTPGSSPLTNPGSDDFSVGTDLKAKGIPIDNFYQLAATASAVDIGGAQRVEAAAAAAAALGRRRIGGGLVGRIG